MGGVLALTGGGKRTEHHDAWLEKLAGWTKVNLGDLLTHPSQVATGPVHHGPGLPGGLGGAAAGAGHPAPGSDMLHQAREFGRGFEYGVVDAGEKVTKTLGGALHLKTSGAVRAEDGLKRSLATGPGVDPNSRAFHWGQGAGTVVAVGGATVAVAGAVAAAAAATPVAGLMAGGTAAVAGAVGLSSGAAAVVGSAAVVMGSEAVGSAIVTGAMGGSRGDVAKAALLAGVAGAGGAAFKGVAAPLLGAVAGAAPRLAGMARVAASGVGGAASTGVAAGVTELAGGGKPGEAWHEALKSAALGGVMGAGAEGVGGIVSRMGAKPRGPVAAGAGDGSLPGHIAREPGRPDQSNNIWQKYSATPEQVAEYVRQPNGKVKVVIHLDGRDVPPGATPAELAKKNERSNLYVHGRMSVIGPDGVEAGEPRQVQVSTMASSKLVKGGSGRVIVQDALNSAGLQDFDADGPDVQLFREFPDQLTGERRMVEAKQGFEPKLSDATAEAIKKLRPKELRDLDVKFVPQPDTAPHAIVAPEPGARLTGQGLRMLATVGTLMKPLQRAAASIVPSVPRDLQINLPLKAMAKQFGDSTGTPLVVPEDLMDRVFGSPSDHGKALRTSLQAHVTDAVRADMADEAPSGTVSGVTPPKLLDTIAEPELSRTVGDAPVEQPWTASYEAQPDGSIKVRAHYTTELYDRYDWGALTEKKQNLDQVPGVTGLFMTPEFREVFFRKRPAPKNAIKETIPSAFGTDAGLYSDALFSTLSARGVAKPFDTIGTTSPQSHEFVIPATGGSEPPPEQ